MVRFGTIRGIIAALVAAVALLGLSTPAQAAFKLRLTAGANTMTIEDLDGDGKVSFDGSFSGWELVVTTGLSKPEFPNDEIATMDITGQIRNRTGGALSPLVIELTDTDFMAPSDGFRSLTSTIVASFQNGASLSFQSFVDNDNAEFNTDGSDPSVHTSGLQGPFNSAVADTAVIDFPLSTPYSITQKITINGTATGAFVSFDALTTVTPAPAGIVLAGIGAVPLAVGAWFRRRRALANS